MSLRAQRLVGKVLPEAHILSMKLSEGAAIALPSMA
jgi:hypothetical protein